MASDSRAVTNSPSAGPRLSKADRRDMLLDAAADLIVELGSTALTMERLAERSGVSKALPYAHFANADDVLIALYQREIAAIGIRVTEAQQFRGEPAERLEAGIHAYFDFLAERGPVLAVLTAPGSAVPLVANAGDDRVAQTFIADLLEETFGIRGERALVTADIMLGALAGGVDSWAQGGRRRRVVEKLAVAFVVAGVNEIAAT